MFVALLAVFPQVVSVASPSQIGLAPATTLIVSDVKLTHDQVARAKGESWEALVKDMRSQRMAYFQKGTAGFFIAESIWQTDNIAREKILSNRLAAAVNQDGSVSLTDPDVASFVQAAAGTVNADVGPDTQVMMGVNVSMTLELGGRQLNVSGGSPTSSERSQLLTHPCTQRSTPSRPSLSDMAPITRAVVVPPSRFNFYLASPTQLERTEEISLYHEAIAGIQARFKAFREQRKSAVDALDKKLSGFDIGNANGTKTSDLPSALRDQLAGQFMSDYQANGFGTRADALAFFNSATISGSNSFPALLLEVGSKGTLGFGLP